MTTPVIHHGQHSQACRACHTPAPHPDARAEAGRRYPMHDRVSVWHEMHQSGYWAFIAGAEWESERTVPDDRVWLALRNMGVQVTNYQVRRALLAERPAPTPGDRDRLARVLWLGGPDDWDDCYEQADALIAAGVTFR